MATIAAYEYESTFSTIIHTDDLADFMSENEVISYEVYDGAADPQSEEDLDIEEDE